MIAIPFELRQVINKLQENTLVEGVLIIGSLTTGTFTAASDYDVVVFLQGMPAMWYVGVTTIAGRFTDVMFVSAEFLQKVQQLTTTISTTHELTPIIRWIAQGTIIIDRNSELQRAREHIHGSSLASPMISRDEEYQAWFSTNYNFAVVCRLLRATNSLYQTTADIRMAVYGHSDVWFNYFTIRGLAWTGDKAAIKYLQAHDPAYLAHYQAFIQATDRQTKFEHYKTTAMLATAPLGGLWNEDETVVNILAPPWTWSDLLHT